jgi:hypothetical protein
LAGGRAFKIYCWEHEREFCFQQCPISTENANAPILQVQSVARPIDQLDPDTRRYWRTFPNLTEAQRVTGVCFQSLRHGLDKKGFKPFFARPTGSREKFWFRRHPDEGAHSEASEEGAAEEVSYGGWRPIDRVDPIDHDRVLQHFENLTLAAEKTGVDKSRLCTLLGQHGADAFSMNKLVRSGNF